MRILRSWQKAGILVLGIWLEGLTAHAQRPAAPPKNEETFRFRFVGPRVGNRIASAAGLPGDTSTIFVLCALRTRNSLFSKPTFVERRDER
jgi:hypothetical protein